jgi:hypothetical protein
LPWIVYFLIIHTTFHRKSVFHRAHFLHRRTEEKLMHFVFFLNASKEMHHQRNLLDIDFWRETKGKICFCKRLPGKLHVYLVLQLCNKLLSDLKSVELSPSFFQTENKACYSQQVFKWSIEQHRKMNGKY